MQRHQETGEVRFIGASKDNPIDRPAGLSENASPEAAARAHLAKLGELFGIQNQAEELRAESSNELDGGRASTHFQQVHEDVPVLGGELNTQVDDANNLLVATGEVLPEISLETEPGVEAKEAQQAALAKIAKDRELEVGGLEASEPELWIYDPSLLGGPDVTRLVWRMEVTPAEGIVDFRELVLVDAQSGAVVLNFDQIHNVRDRNTYDADNTRGALPGEAPTTPARLICTESNLCTDVTLDADVRAVHLYTGQTYDFYFNNHARDSIDNAGMTLRSTVDYCDPDLNESCPMTNAFWNGAQMAYGHGWAAADDVVGHELTHGVTQHESHLFYYYQSGAINESFSDLWGEFIDLSNTTGRDTADTRRRIGEDVPGHVDTGIRDMEHPPTFSDPDRMLSPLYAGGQADAGGVHTNSGVNNKAAYLLTDGGTFNNKTVTKLGIPKVAKIYYEAQTNLLTSASDYKDLHANLQQACINLTYIAATTAADCAEVKDAVDATEMNLTPTAAPNPEAPVCPTGQTPTNLFFDNLENTASGNWRTATTSSTRWSYGATYATSGTTHFWGNNRGVTSDHTIYNATSVTVPTGKTTYLRFNHAYGFEDGYDTLGRYHYYDGGRLEYSTNNGSTWNDAGLLITDNKYSGTISTGLSSTNPLRGRQGFVGESNGYISTRVDLSSLAGQSVRFRFRIGEDADGGDYGWFVDDVRVYTCAIRIPIIVFASNRTTGTGVNNPTGDFEIFSMSPDGGNLRQLTTNDTPDNDPVISPDGTRIAYTNMKTLYVMNVDGSNPTILSRDMFISEEDPTWSPDSTKIAFAAQRCGCAENPGVQDIWTIDASPDSASPMTQLTSTQDYESAPAWSPDGTKIAYVRADNPDGWRGSLSTMSDKGTGQTVILQVSPGWLVSDPAWSPDGGRIAMTTSGPDGYQIAAINADGSNFSIQSPINQDNFQPAWSPDGGKIAFASTRDTVNSNDNHEIYTADITNFWAATRLASDPAQDREPDWGVLPQSRSPITQPPDTTITSGPSGSVSAITASFGFSSSEPGSTFECSLDGAPFSACTSLKEYSALANGEHTFQVRAIGTGGTDPTPASRTWTVVDTATPKVSSVTPANNATGVKRNTNLTATFSEKMDPLSLTKSTFQLFKVNTDGSTTQITNVTVTPSADGLKATLNPFGSSTTLLAKSTKYKAIVTTEAKDVAGNPLDQNPTTSGNQQMVWTFKTGLQ